MKQLILLVFVLILGCKSTEIVLQKPVTHQKVLQKESIKILEKTTIIPHQKLQIVKDEWGSSYIKLLPGKMNVIKNIYKETPVDANLMDAVYAETLWFEAGEKLTTKTYTTGDLQKNPVYVSIQGFRNSRFVKVTKGEIKMEVLDQKRLKIYIKIALEYTQIKRKNIETEIKI